MRPYIQDIMMQKNIVTGINESIKIDSGHFIYRNGGSVVSTGLVNLEKYKQYALDGSRLGFAVSTLVFGDFMYVASQCPVMWKMWNEDRGEVCDLFIEIIKYYGFTVECPADRFQNYMALTPNTGIAANSSCIGTVVDGAMQTIAIVQVTDENILVFLTNDFDVENGTLSCYSARMSYSWTFDIMPAEFGTTGNDVAKYKEQVIAGALAACGIRLRENDCVSIVNTSARAFYYQRSEDTDIYEKLGDVYKFCSYHIPV